MEQEEMLQQDLIDQFNLPKYTKDKSFADASKLIEAQFKDRNDKASLDTKNEFLSRLADAQEYVKQVAQAQQAEQQGSQEQLMQQLQMEQGMQGGGQEIPQEMAQMQPGGGGQEEALMAAMAQQGQGLPTQNQQEDGGWGNKNPIGGGTIDYNTANGESLEGASSSATGTFAEGAGGKIGGALGGANTLLNIGMDAYGTTGVKNDGYSRYKKKSEGGTALSGAASGAMAGAAIGSLFPGLGTVIGGVAGGLYGGISGAINAGKYNKSAGNANANADVTDNAQHNNRYEGGGELNPFDINNPFNSTPKEGYGLTIPNLSNNFNSGLRHRPEEVSIGDTLKPHGIKSMSGGYDYKLPGDKKVPSSSVREPLNDRTPSWLESNYGSILQTAPIAANAIQLANLKKPSGVSLNRLNNRYEESRLDEARMLNNIKGSMNLGLAKEASGGSLSNFGSNARQLMLDRTKLVSGAYGAHAAKQAEDKRAGQAFNAEIDKANLIQANSEQDINDRNKAAYETQKSKLVSQLGNDVGAFGKEANHKKIVKEMFSYTWDGKYVKDKKGSIVKNKDGKPMTKEELEYNKRIING